MADGADVEFEAYAARLAETRPLETAGLNAIYAVRLENYERAAEALVSLFRGLRGDPWIFRHVVEVVLDLAVQTAHAEPRLAIPLFEALDEPFAGRLLEEERKIARVAIGQAAHSQRPEMLIDALESLEPHTP